MIATIGTFIVWILIVVGGIAGVFFAFIGLMFFINFRR